MDNKKQFQEALITVIRFNEQDVITMSGEQNWDDDINDFSFGVKKI